MIGAPRWLPLLRAVLVEVMLCACAVAGASLAVGWLIGRVRRVEVTTLSPVVGRPVFLGCSLDSAGYPRQTVYDLRVAPLTRGGNQ